ncbi:glycosyltransferase [Burkholderia cenocepacia]|uniref:glycosyltransferase n=2 Tax=Burkholderia cenocepacia TaxID=95486 RepID=UPI002655FF47|nr:glycosyltransferase [Burkholderia cenocepacia]MDN7457922.1 glycosyltransferase [Burkholderia cenocepacia]
MRPGVEHAGAEFSLNLMHNGATAAVASPNIALQSTSDATNSRQGPHSRRVRAINQFHSGSAIADAVTNSMFMIQALLRELGFESEIFAEHVAPELVGRIRYFREYDGSADDVMLLHHSMGHDQDEWILSLPCTTVLIYHNITPESFFDERSPFRHYSVKGRAQLDTFREHFAAAIAVSDLNAQELRERGYEKVETIPLLIDAARIRTTEWNDALVQEQSQVSTILFVGRVSPNKAHRDIVEAAAQLRAIMPSPFQVTFVGGYGEEEPYYLELCKLIDELELGEIVRFAGKVSDADLYGWYRSAALFLCLSDHEGFGVPLIEAMTFDVPVIAYASSNIESTLGGAGLLVHDKHPQAVAALARAVLEDRALRRAVIVEQRKRVRQFERPTLLNQLQRFLRKEGIEIPRPIAAETADGGVPALRYQVEGPFETSYSLALVNRELAFALDRANPGEVGLFATEGPGDYAPDTRRIAAIPGLPDLVTRGSKRSGADVVIRDLYPPRVHDMDGLFNFLHFAWEESELPAAWVASFNENLDGIAATSAFVAKVARDNGFAGTIANVGLGLDHVARTPRREYRGTLGKGFRFLHVSSCFPRKGVDVLLDAFAKAFTARDDVSLIIKTFPNPHNTVAEQIAALRRRYPDCPEIVLIDADLDAGEIVDLYHRCHAFVAPSRGEGFGLPMGEAMWFGLPVITTAFGGQTDFCTDETAWLVDYTFEGAKSHLGLFDSVWAEPSVDSLAAQLRAVHAATDDVRRAKAERGRALLEAAFTWDRCAARFAALETAVGAIEPASSGRTRLAWISSWNTKCGIATYSSFLVAGLDPAQFDVRVLASRDPAVIVADGPEVTRCWTDQRGRVDELIATLEQCQPDAIVLQHNYGFFSMESTARIVEYAHAHAIPIVVTFHSTKDVDTPELRASLSEIVEALRLADRLLVHGLEDLNRLRALGLAGNATLFPHGVHAREATDRLASRAALNLPADAPVIATYGFLLPHKGLEEVIDAFALLLPEMPEARLLMVNALYPVADSETVAQRCSERIKTLGLGDSVRMITEFLPDRESFAYLDAADLIVFAYQDTAESASGAVRYGIAANRPVACTPIPIFDDLGEMVHRFSGTDAHAISDSLGELLRDRALLGSKAEAQAAWIRARSWDEMSARLGGMVRGLAVARNGGR